MASNIGDSVRGGYWLEGGGLASADIRSDLFTHLFCAFATLNANRVVPTPNCMSFPQIVRRRNSSVKTLLSIGGGAVGSDAFSIMASEAWSRLIFINSSIDVARSYAYEGLDLDWEGQNTEVQMTNLAILLREWRDAINAEAVATGRQPLLLTAAVSVFPKMFERPKWPTAALERYLDWVNVMAYDFYSPAWSRELTGAPASLLDPTNRISGTMGINAWDVNGTGVSPGKLVFGLPFYGYAWKLLDPNTHGILAPADGIDTSIGDRGDGSVSYRDIMQRMVNQRGAQIKYDGDYVTNYCYSGTAWVGYDDKQTIVAKVQYAKHNVRGYFAWHLGQDDINSTLSTQAAEAWGH